MLANASSAAKESELRSHDARAVNWKNNVCDLVK